MHFYNKNNVLISVLLVGLSRHETPADFDATLMSEGFDDANSTLGSHFSVRRRDSRDYDRDFRATPKGMDIVFTCLGLNMNLMHAQSTSS